MKRKSKEYEKQRKIDYEEQFLPRHSDSVHWIRTMTCHDKLPVLQSFQETHLCIGGQKGTFSPLDDCTAGSDRDIFCTTATAPASYYT